MKASIVFSPDFSGGRARDIGEAFFNADTGEACIVALCSAAQLLAHEFGIDAERVASEIAAFNNRLCAGHYFTCADVMRFAALECGRLTLGEIEE